jgi:hypothetical protein
MIGMRFGEGLVSDSLTAELEKTEAVLTTRVPELGRSLVGFCSWSFYRHINAFITRLKLNVEYGWDAINRVSY